MEIISRAECVICGAAYTLTHRGRVTCGKVECRRERSKLKHRKPKIEKECTHCGAAFLTARSWQVRCGDPECECGRRREYHLNWKSTHRPRVDHAERPCAYCGKIYKPKAKNRRTCGGDKCKRAAAGEAVLKHRPRRDFPEKPCDVCGAMFKPHTSKGRICGADECKKALRDEITARHRVIKNYPEVSCSVCGAMFKPRRRKRALWGSQLCGSEYCKRETHRRAHMRRSVLIEKECPICGQIITPDNSWNKHCDSCRTLLKRKRTTGHMRAIQLGVDAVPFDVGAHLDAFNGKCHYCYVDVIRPATRDVATFDNHGEAEHVLCMNHGGPHALDNMVLACRACNNTKRSILHEAIKGPPTALIDVFLNSDWLQARRMAVLLDEIDHCHYTKDMPGIYARPVAEYLQMAGL